MVRIGFLHTADVHVDTFAALVDEHAERSSADQATSHHLVRTELLDHARVHGIDDRLRAALAAALDELGQTASSQTDSGETGLDIIVCTCSTISGVAERSAEGTNVEVVRIDRPMASAAVARAASSETGGIAVVTAVESAAAPALDLLTEEASKLEFEPIIESVFCDGAWAHFEAGDNERFLDTVASAIDQIDSATEVVVIAQASMAGAAHRTANPDRVLTSPALSVAAAFDRSGA